MAVLAEKIKMENTDFISGSVLADKKELIKHESIDK